MKADDVYGSINEAQHTLALVLDEYRHVDNHVAPEWLKQLRDANYHLSNSLFWLDHQPVSTPPASLPSQP